MTARVRVRGAMLLCALALGGCHVQAGTALGGELRVNSSSGAVQASPVWEGSARAEFAPGAHGGGFGGVSTDLRATPNGARVLLGLRGGYAWNMQQRPGQPGFALTGELGAPVRSGVLFGNYSFYAGVTGSWVWWLGPAHTGAALNRAIWYFHGVPELVLEVRGRVHVDDPALESTRALLFDLSVGVALRVRFVSDLL